MHKKSAHTAAFRGALFAGLTVFATSFTALAQTPASSSATAPKNEDEPVQLAVFEVVMTQDKGYNTPYSGSALKTNEEIMKVPQSITVITRDMIDDIASFDLSDALNYVGVGNFQQGESAYVRGVGVSITTDGGADSNVDNAAIDSITIVRGPVAVLYGGVSSLTGAVIRQTRIPFGNKRRTSLKTQLDQWGFYRADLDHSSPLGKVGDTEFSYRVSIANQGGSSFLRNVTFKRQVYYGVLQLKHHDTTFRINVQAQKFTQPPHKNNILKPDGTVWEDAGRDESFHDKASMIDSESNSVRVAWIQRFSPYWSFSGYGSANRSEYGPQSVLIVNNVNYQTNTLRLFARNNHAVTNNFAANGDLNGNYTVLNRKLRTSMGVQVWNNRRSPYDHVANPDFGAQNATLGTPVRTSATGPFTYLDIPLSNVRYVFDHIVNVPANQYAISPTTSLGTRVDNTESNVYIYQNAELIPNRLTVMGSLSTINNTNINRAYTAANASTPGGAATENRNDRTFHRVGFVLNVTKDLAIYGIETTMATFLNSTSRLADGSFIPPRDGILREIGVKSMLWNGRVTATAAIYDNHFKNYAVARTGVVDPVLGYVVFDLVDDSFIKGWDFSLSSRPLPNWQVMVNYTSQNPRVQFTGNRLPASFRSSWSFFTRCDFKSGEFLKKFSVGGGANRFEDRITSASSLILPDGRTASTLANVAGSTGVGGQMGLKEGTMVKAFIEYHHNRTWDLRLDVNNVLDEHFAVGAQHAAAIDPAPPRTFSLIATVKF